MKTEKFKNCTQREQRIIRDFPIMTKQWLTAANDLFCHYVFYRTEKAGLRLWTSCCHKSNEFYAFCVRTQTPNHTDFLSAKHNEKVICPYCGRTATKKCVGKIGKGIKLWERNNAVFLQEENGVLTAQAYTLEKTYEGRDGAENRLARAPEFCFAAAYRFTQGQAMQITQSYYTKEYLCSYEERQLTRTRRVTEPFGSGGYMGGYENYRLIGEEALLTGFAQYSQYGSWIRQRRDYACTRLHYALIRYLTIYAVYPRQLEMLVKSGMLQPVNDMVYERKKNAAILNWSEENPQKALRMNAQESRALRTSKQSGDQCFDLLLRLAELKKAGEVISVVRAVSPEEQARPIWELMDVLRRNGQSRELILKCRGLGVKPSRLAGYLQRFTGVRCHGGYFGIGQAWTLWRDTMTMAENLGFDTTAGAVAFPSDLERKHSEYQDLTNEKNRAEQERRDRESTLTRQEKKLAYEKRRKTLEKKYAFTLGTLLIRVPRDAREIQDEGKALEHCVAGYANRHENGTATILFLRETVAPDRPFLTIEMNGNSLVQIHGYKNEGIHSCGGRFAPDPRKVHAGFIDSWLAWLKAGSRRSGDASPILPGKKAAKSA